LFSLARGVKIDIENNVGEGGSLSDSELWQESLAEGRRR